MSEALKITYEKHKEDKEDKFAKHVPQWEKFALCFNNRFTYIHIVGKGTFASVCTCIDNQLEGNRDKVIKLFLEEDVEVGINSSAIREMIALRQIVHNRIVSLHEVLVTSEGSFGLTFEPLKCNLKTRMEMKCFLNPHDV